MQIPNFMKSHGNRVVSCEQIDRRTDLTKLIVAFRNSANAPKKTEVCVTVHHWYSYINSQLDTTITNFIDNYNQLNMFRAVISPILRSTSLCLQLVV